MPSARRSRLPALQILEQVPSVHRTSQRRRTPGQQHEAPQTREHQMRAQQLSQLRTREPLQMPAQQLLAALQTRELLLQMLQMPVQLPSALQS